MVKIHGRHKSILQNYKAGDLNFAFDQRENEVKLPMATSSLESPSNVSHGAVGDRSIINRTGYIAQLINTNIPWPR